MITTTAILGHSVSARRFTRWLLLSTILAAAAGGQMAAGIFTQKPTSFGPGTALGDNSTGLEWLHLNFTANHSYTDVVSNLAPNGIYGGWRFATPAELGTFFLDYAGGRVNDTLAANLMSDLGGPLCLCALGIIGVFKLNARGEKHSSPGVDASGDLARYVMPGVH